MNQRQLSASVFLCTALAACAGSAPSPAPTPLPSPDAPAANPAPRPPSTSGTPLPGRTAFSYSRGSSSYEISTDASIVSPADVGGQPLLLSDRATVSLTLEPSDQHVIVTGSVQSRSQTPAGTTAAVSLPAAAFVDTVWVGTAPPAGPELLCGRAQPPPAQLTAFLPSVGGELQQGQRWERTYIYSICQGPIPVRVERTDSYIVQGSAREAGPDGIAIARNSTARFTGRGVEGQHNVAVEGSGSARAVFQLDARAGQLVRGTEESTSDIGVTASGRTQRFTQTMTRRINRLP